MNNHRSGVFMKNGLAVRPFFRVLSWIIAVLFLVMGSMAVAEGGKEGGIVFGGNLKFGLASIFWGIIFLIVAIRGRKPFFHKR